MHHIPARMQRLAHSRVVCSEIVVQSRSTKNAEVVGAIARVMLGLRYGACCDRGMSYARQRLGERGESMACDALEQSGYAIVARRYRTRFGEIDVIADDHGTVVFVEVKTKTDCSFSDP